MVEMKEVLEQPPSVANGRAHADARSHADVQPERHAQAAGQDPPPPSPSRTKTYGRIFEMLSVASLAGCFVVFGLDVSFMTALAAAFGLALVFFATLAAALRCADRASRIEKERAASLRYKVTTARIKTLRAVKVPMDVTDALNRFVGAPPMSRDEFLEALAHHPSNGLGDERTKEYEEQILRYTKADEPAPRG